MVIRVYLKKGEGSMGNWEIWEDLAGTSRTSQASLTGSLVPAAVPS